METTENVLHQHSENHGDSWEGAASPFNISYGKLGLTNSKTVFDLLDGNVIYGSSEELLEKYISTEASRRVSLFNNAVSLIKNKHTYINRINSILSVI